jgi:hypothetical protein
LSKQVKRRYDPQGPYGYWRNGRVWPLPVPFPDLDKEIEIRPGRTVGNKKEYVDWVRVRWIQDYRMQAFDRWIAETAGLPARCRRAACRRGGHCSDPAVLCVYEKDAELSESFYPAFRAALKREQDRRVAAGEDMSVPDMKTIIADFRTKHPKPR